MIYYKDFVPELLEKGGMFRTNLVFSSLKETLHDANAWIEQSRVKVINIETVVLPNIHGGFGQEEEGSADVDLRDYGSGMSRWHQFIRVWYQD